MARPAASGEAIRRDPCDEAIRLAILSDRLLRL